ncbi:MAG TPA: methylenetetrahydrofolate reductase [Polyangiaceae bacterium]|nr:methylenetetrahydrofolate reductase [Polyangiaceae bacterium]
MKIAKCLEEAEVALSFEFFPPKDPPGVERLLDSARRLSAFSPTFVSVTYGAGGSSRHSTAALCQRLMVEEGLCAMAHLTCAGATVEELQLIAAEFRERGLENVLALRGDPPRGDARFRAAEGGFAHASELIAFLRSNFDFGIAAACYPEKHSEAPSLSVDLARLREKLQAGAEFLITQVFFEPSLYVNFVANARAAGIHAPIVPGILPATDLPALLRMCARCGAEVPAFVTQTLARHEHDPQAMFDAGIELTVSQCRALLAAGAPGLHFFTRNRWVESAAILERLAPSLTASRAHFAQGSSSTFATPPA